MSKIVRDLLGAVWRSAYLPEVLHLHGFVMVCDHFFQCRRFKTLEVGLLETHRDHVFFAFGAVHVDRVRWVFLQPAVVRFVQGVTDPKDCSQLYRLKAWMPSSSQLGVVASVVRGQSQSFQNCCILVGIVTIMPFMGLGIKKKSAPNRYAVSMIFPHFVGELILPCPPQLISGKKKMAAAKAQSLTTWNLHWEP